MAKPRVHIYLLSRLAFADVTEWRRIIKQLQEGRKSIYWSYKPLRMGAYQLAANRDTGGTRAIYSDVAHLAEKAGGQRCRKANLAALEVFERFFMPNINKAERSFMEGIERPVDFGPMQLIGGPHFSVLDDRNRKRYVYLHPSRWKEEEVAAFCELLTVIVEGRFNSEAASLWFLDLRAQRRHPWTASRKLVRRKCLTAAEFLMAFQAANLAEGGE